MNKFLTVILGTTDVDSFMSACFFALLGVVLTLLIHSTFRDVNSTKSPVQFSWKYLFCDNLRRLVVGIITIFIALRFSTEMFGIHLTPFLGLTIGVWCDKLGEKIQAIKLPGIGKEEPNHGD